MIIVGAGPIGIELASALKRSGIDYLHFEGGQIGNTIMAWPRNAVFFSNPEWVAISGVPIQTDAQGNITGEAYLSYLRQAVELLDLPIRSYEPVEEIERLESGFRVTTASASGRHGYLAKRVALAVGGMSFPNTLGIPGEDLPHATHFFSDPHRYFRRKLLVVGGGNTALEVALRCWRAGADVTLSYRGPELQADRVNSRLLLDINILRNKGKLRFIPETVPVEIRSATVALGRGATERIEIAADFVVLATGFRPDQLLYRQLGVDLVGAEHAPRFDEATMETNVPGLYAAGTTAGGWQGKRRLFITTCHDHTAKILRHAYGIETVTTGNIPGRNYSLSNEDIG